MIQKRTNKHRIGDYWFHCVDPGLAQAAHESLLVALADPLWARMFSGPNGSVPVHWNRRAHDVRFERVSEK